MKRAIKISVYILVPLVLVFGSFLGGVHWGFEKGVEVTEFAHKLVNQMPDYDPTLKIVGFTSSNITSTGFRAVFLTEEPYSLFVEWTVYPSDVFSGVPCNDSDDGLYHNFEIHTFPEGGTVMYRIRENPTPTRIVNHGTEWLYLKLPYPEPPNLLLPPYKR